MRNEQIIEFELSEPGSWLLVVYVLLKLVIFMIKQKSPRQILEWIIIYYLLKILHEALNLASPYLDQATCKI